MYAPVLTNGGFFSEVTYMPQKFDEEICKKLLSEKAEELKSAGETRYPKRSDFSDEEVVAIKAFLGPWPRALEKSGVKPFDENGAYAHRLEKRRKKHS